MTWWHTTKSHKNGMWRGWNRQTDRKRSPHDTHTKMLKMNKKYWNDHRRLYGLNWMSFRTTFMTDKSGKGGRERERENHWIFVVEIKFQVVTWVLCWQWQCSRCNQPNSTRPKTKLTIRERERKKTHINADCVQWDRETIEIIFAALNFVIE